MENTYQWLTKNVIGQQLVAKESKYLNLVLGHLLANDFCILVIGPLNIIDKDKLKYNNCRCVHLSASMPCEVSSDFAQLPFAAYSFDIVISYHAFEGCVEKVGFLKELRRVLKPEGYLMLDCFNPNRLWFSNPKWQGKAILKRRDCLTVNTFSQNLNSHSFLVTEGKFLGYLPLNFQIKSKKIRNFIEHAGDRWWPHLSGVYVLVAQKKVIPFLYKTKNDSVKGTARTVLMPLTNNKQDY